jgi:hypothetical protein
MPKERSLGKKPVASSPTKLKQRRKHSQPKTRGRLLFVFPYIFGGTDNLQQNNWIIRAKRFLIELTCLILLILTITEILWEHMRHLFR